MNSSIKTSLEDYFEFLSDDDIRLKGHRIGIDDVIDYYLQGYSLEQILVELPSLNLEKLLRLNPAIDVLRIGDLDTPPLGTLAPEILRYLERSAVFF